MIRGKVTFNIKLLSILSAANLSDAAGVLPRGRLAAVRPQRDDGVLHDALPGAGGGGAHGQALQDAAKVWLNGIYFSLVDDNR